MRLESLLSASAQHAPDSPAAFEVDGASINYRDLDRYAEEVCRALNKGGVGAGDRVGLCVPKGIAALASVFGILKARSAYVPVDVAAPPSRNGYIFNDCAVAAVIIHVTRADALEAELGPGWTRSEFCTFPDHPADFLLLTREDKATGGAGAGDLAYILYTSGSTGRPKGVMHSHATAMAFIDWCSEEFAPTPVDRFSSHAPFHFDLSILDIYLPIKHGGSVVLISSEAGKQPGTLAEIIEARKITIWYSTPSILRMLMDYAKLEERDLSTLRIVNFAGEVFPIKHLRSLTRLLPNPVYYNLYGPTETNVCTFHKVTAIDLEDDARSLPIGRACSGDDMRVVDATGNDVAPGDEGELLVSGGSVMLGYWNLPERNAEAFQTLTGAAWYRTGDIVREVETGVYIFLGRRDRMVKKRGFRVELGEIESALHRHPNVSEAAVVATRSAEGEIEILAFAVWSGDKPASTIKMKQFCSENLPIYMTPDRFTFMAALPKTSTDKIDYQRLLENR